MLYRERPDETIASIRIGDKASYPRHRSGMSTGEGSSPTIHHAPRAGALSVFCRTLFVVTDPFWSTPLKTVVSVNFDCVQQNRTLRGE